MSPRTFRSIAALAFGAGLVLSLTSPALTQRAPRALEIEKQMFPSLAEVTGVFEAVGFRTLALDAVNETYAATAAEAAAKLRLRAISTFEHMTEAEIEEGFARMDAYVAAGPDALPDTGQSDLLVLG